jgi:hypothetical protein
LLLWCSDHTTHLSSVHLMLVMIMVVVIWLASKTVFTHCQALMCTPTHTRDSATQIGWDQNDKPCLIQLPEACSHCCKVPNQSTQIFTFTRVNSWLCMLLVSLW